MEPRSTRDIEILFKLIVKVLVVGITKFGSPHGLKKIWPQWGLYIWIIDQV